MNGLKLSQLKQVTENTIQFLKCMNIILLLKKVAYYGLRIYEVRQTINLNIYKPLHSVSCIYDVIS